MDNRDNKNSEISEGRKILYYGGMGLGVIGFLTFISNFFSRPSMNGGFGDFGSQMDSMATRGITGMLMIIGGFVLMNIGARGAAGSGLILDPKKAREDVKPWSKMTGGVINDALSEVDLGSKINVNQGQSTKEVVKIKCRNCGALNDEDAKFCKECGREV